VLDPEPPEPEPEPPEPVELPPPGEVVKVRVLLKPTIVAEIPEGSRIVITDISGVCALEVKDALMSRLVDNANYDVLTRENLSQILVESEKSWAGDFNTKTAVRLGELLGASLFVVGRVVYCGPPPGDEQTEEDSGRVDIFAILQILDLETGKVLVSSAIEGTYTPKSAPLLVADDAESRLVTDAAESLSAAAEAAAEAAADQESPSTAADTKTSPAKSGFLKNLFQSMKIGGWSSGKPSISIGDSPPTPGDGSPPASGGNGESEDSSDQAELRINHPIFKAAEDLANGFADKFFSRPTWGDVEMWTTPRWSYGESIRYVKLGHCSRAVGLLESVAAQELSFMPESDVARFLHNYGVALLCNNELEKAVSKLRSAYRIDYDDTTLAMLELAFRITEWSLTVEVDREPEVKMLAKRPPSS
jgi:hypothetical protein